MAADKRFRQAELTAERAHLVLEQFAQRLDQLHVHALRQAADIVVRFYGHRRAAGKGDALDDVGIERSLRQKMRAANLFGFRLEHLDEELADGLALFLGIGDASELFEKELPGFDVPQRDVIMAAEQRDHTLGLSEAKQPVIDEHAGELIAYRFVDEHGGNGGIDTAGKTADHLVLADLAADFFNRLVPERAHGPVAGAA